MKVVSDLNLYVAFKSPVTDLKYVKHHWLEGFFNSTLGVANPWWSRIWGNMILNIIDAKYLRGYEIWLRFDNGVEKTVDLKNAIFCDHREIFKPLREIEYFKKFTIKYNTITWPNEADFAPEFLCEIGKEIKNITVGATHSG